MHATPKYVDNSNYYFINGNNLDNKNIIINENTKCVPVEEYEKHRITFKNTILISINGTIGNLAFYDNEKVILGKSAAYINLNENMDKEFIFNYLQIGKIKYYFQSELTGTTIKNLSLRSLKNTKVYLPTSQEQNKVSKFLELVDKKIILLEKKYICYKDFKKYLMQEIFAQNLRFDFNDEWKEYAFKKLLKEVNEKTTVNNQHEILSSTKDGIFAQKDYFADRNVASKDNTGYKILRKNQIVLSPQNLWMGNINVNTDFEIGIVSPSYKIYGTTDFIEIDFFKHVIKFPRLIYEYTCASEQGASIVRRNLNKQLFNEIKIKVPSIKEQQMIGTMLNLMDKKITGTSKQIDELKEFKKGLLQQMFV